MVNNNIGSNTQSPFDLYGKTAIVTGASRRIAVASQDV